MSPCMVHILFFFSFHHCFLTLPMIQEYQVRVLPRDAYTEEAIAQYLIREKGLDQHSLTGVRVLRRSIDARQRTVYVNLTVRAYINEMPQKDMFERVDYGDVSERPQVVVVGAGPGGLFAALRLIELGVRPIVLERGKDVRERKLDLARIARTHVVDPESNYCFGEGGAGAYSDGKLFTRSKKRGNVRKILNVFCQHGAPSAILSDVHPHIGTDRLPRVIENMREQIRKSGGEVYFRTRMTELIFSEQQDRVIGVRAVQGEDGVEKEFFGPVILATGHSARDVYRYLHKNGVPVEAKGIAVGVRLEHPAQLIDQIQYHSRQGRGQYLPAAEYSFVTQVDGRGVYSFCMCPGGFVIPSATGPEQVVTNGMSPFNRGTRWSNSGMVVQVEPEDAVKMLEWKEEDNTLAVLAFQEHLERLAWLQGGRTQVAPAQRMADFVNKRLSADLPDASYAPGLLASPLHFWMPQPIVKGLKEAFLTFGRHAHGFLTNEATMIGVETRTSSPVRILRNRETFQHVTIAGLFPCGEGAGYAGGIVSAAMDGECCAERAAQFLG